MIFTYWFTSLGIGRVRRHRAERTWIALRPLLRRPSLFFSIPSQLVRQVFRESRISAAERECGRRDRAGRIELDHVRIEGASDGSSVGNTVGLALNCSKWELRKRALCYSVLNATAEAAWNKHKPPSEHSKNVCTLPN